MKKHWFFLFLKKSISQRTGRVIIASISVTLAVAVITGMIGITAGVRDKLGAALKAYGANIIVSSAEDGYIDAALLDEIVKIDHITDAEGQIFGSVQIEGESIEIIGLDLTRLRERGWRLSGGWPAKRGDILAGTNLKQALQIDTGRSIRLSHSLEKEDKGGVNKKEITFTVSGFIERGGAEDNAFILSIADAWELTGLDNKFNTILVRGDTGRLPQVIKGIRDAFPSAVVRTFRQIALAEESLLGRVQLLMALVTVVVLFGAVISVGSTMGANVLDRREEIGLMMVIGATKNEISLIYAAEAVLIGILGGLAGFILGYVSAQIISKGAFDSYISMPFYTAFIALIAGLFVSISAGSFPVRDALRHSPAEMLRGE